MDGVRGFRYDFADMLDEMGKALKEFGGLMQTVGKATPGKIGRGMEASGNMLAMMGNGFTGLLAKQMRPGIPREYDSGAAMLKDLNRFVDELNRPMPEKAVGEVGQIEGPVKAMAATMSDAAKKFYDDATRKGTALEIFRGQGQAAMEAARFKPAEGDQMFMSLAGKFLDLEKGLADSFKLELPTTMKAGSHEAESVITRAMADPGQQTGQERVEAAIKRLTDGHDRELVVHCSSIVG